MTVKNTKYPRGSCPVCGRSVALIPSSDYTSGAFYASHNKPKGSGIKSLTSQCPGSYLGIRKTEAKDNPPAPAWLKRYLDAIEAASSEARKLADLAYSDPRRFSPQFSNVAGDLHEIETLAKVGEHRVSRDKARLAPLSNPAGDPRPGVYTYDPKRFPLPLDSYEIADPGGRGRKPKIRINPRIVEGELPRDLPWIKPPETFAMLGELVEVVIRRPDDSERTIRARENAAALLATKTETDLWIVWPSSHKIGKLPRGAAAEKKLFRKWSGFNPSVSIKFSASDKLPGAFFGWVLIIRYRSDKWTGEPELYEHRFEVPRPCYADNARSPKTILVMSPSSRGEKTLKIVSSRGLVN